MKHDLFTIGLEICEKVDAEHKLYLIKNNDGSPRWMWNASNPTPQFLKFYNISATKAKIFSFVLKAIFKLNLQHIIFKRNEIFVRSTEDNVLKPYLNQDFALFFGTVGPNRKLVLYSEQKFFKIALNNQSEKILENEAMVLSLFESGTNFKLPIAKRINHRIVSFTDISKNGKRVNNFTSKHASALQELQTNHNVSFETFGKVPVFQSAVNDFLNSEFKEQTKSPDFLIEKLNLISKELFPLNLTFTWGHMDFTPWNCFVSKDKIMIYDFELANTQLPFGYDAFHFVFQQSVLVERLTWKKIKPKLREAFELMKHASSRKSESFITYLKAYLLINISFHLALYNNQEKWHEQIQWLICTWNDALSDLLNYNVKHRELLIGDVFDFLKPQKYATVKFPDLHPKLLNENSDIDLITNKSVAYSLCAYLSSHSLVSKINIQRLSNMTSVFVMLKNGQLLSIDMIWKLKRKSMVFMDAHEAINNSVFNEFNIKTTNIIQTQQYLKCFYGLNNSQIPEKYHSSFQNDSAVFCKKTDLQRSINKMPENKGFRFLSNCLAYYSDVIRKFFFQKGLVVTFSGVDGAGKSTIIQHTKLILEKRLRRKVVVLRHRPSMLPILSAFFEGKERAEMKAANSLPRQGKNKSYLSSGLRFLYYYTDYFVGQFLIFAMHTLRGDIVLYDRYYFDFINDGKRSNIGLPKWLTKIGYRLLLKPNLNFFLYADPQTILNRKKELNEHTINELTSQYKDLFTELSEKSHGRYYCLENLELEKSLSFISQKVQLKML